jgi:hypothetical protein
MSSIVINNYSEKDYIVEPFTIDDKKARTLDDAFSITCDRDGKPVFNIHISGISLEYLKIYNELNKFITECNNKKIKKHIDNDLKKSYSLQEGLRKVVTLNIKKDNNKYMIHNISCEEIPIIKNLDYSNNISTDFYCIMREILDCNKFDNHHDLVTFLMGYYSRTMSYFLYNCDERYMFKKNFINGNDFRIGSFTSPLRKQDSLLNQFILLHFLKSTIREDYIDNLLLYKSQLENKNNKSIIYINNFSHHGHIKVNVS